MLGTILQSSSFIHLMAYEELNFFIFFFANLAFLLPWKPIKLQGLDKNGMSGIILGPYF